MQTMKKNSMETLKQQSMKRMSVLMVLCLVLMNVGCQRYHDTSAFVMDTEHVADTKPYTIGPPDVIMIRAVQVPEINNGAVIVQPDGKIILPLLGEMYVAGMTPGEVAKAVEVKSREFYNDVDVVVQVAEYRSKHIYVFGEVGMPGRYAYTGADTILDVLSRAQPTRLSDPNRIQIFRRGGNGEMTHKMTIELDQWVKHGEVTRNGIVAEGDLIFVPPNGLASVGLAIQQLLLPISPAASVVNGPASIDSSVTQLSGTSGAK